MRRWILGMVVLAVCGGVCGAQEQPTPQQLKKMYTDSLDQLKAAQDRKNQLSAENEKLTKENAQLTTQVSQLQKQLAELKEEKSHFLDRTFFFRAYYAAWRRFLQVHPHINARWEDFISNDFPPMPPPSRPPVFDSNWPLTAAG